MTLPLPAPRVAIVAALAREIGPLVKGWTRETVAGGATVYIAPRAIVAYAGMGARCAGAATHAALSLGPVRRVISVGWAGGLRAGLPVGLVSHVGKVIDAASGQAFSTEDDGPALVSVMRFASADEKRRLREEYSADLVDMEAFAVARIAHGNGLPFSAFKAVSDEYDFDLLDMERFASANGQFREAAFAAHIALRPWLWSRVAAMARNSAKAAGNLCAVLEGYLRNDAEGA